MQTNIISIDLEDWRQSTFDNNAPISSQVVDNTKVILDIFAKYQIKATFFCLGLVARKFPQIIKAINSHGHEIGTHGWSHKSVKQLGKDKFKLELFKSIEILEQLTGDKVVGHRAPDFSIDLNMNWAFNIMQEAGLIYDSSIFPVKGKRYGSPECNVAPFKLNELWEIPLSTVSFLGRQIAVLGGGYFRLYPIFLSKYFIKKINAENRPAIVYLHPYEINYSELKRMDIPFKVRIHQGMFRRCMKKRIEYFISKYRFTSIQGYLNAE